MKLSAYEFSTQGLTHIHILHAQILSCPTHNFVIFVANNHSVFIPQKKGINQHPDWFHCSKIVYGEMYYCISKKMPFFFFFSRKQGHM